MEAPQLDQLLGIDRPEDLRCRAVNELLDGDAVLSNFLHQQVPRCRVSRVAKSFSEADSLSHLVGGAEVMSGKHLEHDLGAISCAGQMRTPQSTGQLPFDLNAYRRRDLMHGAGHQPTVTAPVSDSEPDSNDHRSLRAPGGRLRVTWARRSVAEG